MKRLFALIALLLAFVCPALAQDYPDGIYRGFYYDGGIEQIAIQFELKDGIFTSLIYRGVKYKDGDYMNEDASDAQKAILHQYRQLAEYLVGKDISAIDDLYSPYDIGEDLDALLGICDRILVLCGGEAAGYVKPAETTKNEIGYMMMNGGIGKEEMAV